MYTPSKVDITLLNAMINPYDGKRPRIVDRKYNIKRMFKRTGTVFPYKLIPEGESVYLDHIVIDVVSVCQPGGRGCVGKERMGTKLTDRQTAMKTSNGIFLSPRIKNHNNDDPKSYGFLQLSGLIVYKDGSTGNINIPVEASGVIGLRTGASKNLKVNTNNSNSSKNLMKLVGEIQNTLLKFLKIKLYRIRIPKIKLFRMRFLKLKFLKIKFLNWILVDRCAGRSTAPRAAAAFTPLTHLGPPVSILRRYSDTVLIIRSV
jgi:hypothetical protein